MAKKKVVKVKVPEVPEVDASILQFVPKGGFYNPTDMQMRKMEELWGDFFSFDRIIFALSTILPGTAYSKGRMAQMLLSNPIKQENALVKYGLYDDFEYKVMLYNLMKETPSRSLKNLLMLAGIKDKKTKEIQLPRINNARTRKLILEYIFARPDASLDGLAVKFKQKLRKLIRHALGKQNLHNILKGDSTLFKLHIGRYKPSAMQVMQFLFNVDTESLIVSEGFKKIALYEQLKVAAAAGNSDDFVKIAEEKQLPVEVLIGYKNQAKLDIDLKKIYEVGQMSNRQKLQTESAAKRTGAKTQVNYYTQDIYDLWKVLYHKLISQETDDFDRVIDAITKKSTEKAAVNFGETVVIFDCSYSMRGSVQRPMHPFYTGLSLVSTLDNIKKVIYVGGSFMNTPSDKWPKLIMPRGGTKLWEALLQAAEMHPETILVITDGYENTVQGSFESVYQYLRDNGHTFKLVQINPVFAAETSGARRIVSTEPALPLTDHKFLETNFIFGLLKSHSEQIKTLLANKFKDIVLKEVNQQVRIEGIKSR